MPRISSRERTRRARISAGLRQYHAKRRDAEAQAQARERRAQRARQVGYRAWLQDVRQAQAILGPSAFVPAPFRQAVAVIRALRKDPERSLAEILAEIRLVELPPPPPPPPLPPPPLPPSIWQSPDTAGEFAFNLQDVDRLQQSQGMPSLWTRFQPDQVVTAAGRFDVFTGGPFDRTLAGSVDISVPITVGRSEEETWRAYFAALRAARGELSRERLLAAGIDPAVVDDALELAQSGKSGEGFAAVITQLG